MFINNMKEIFKIAHLSNDTVRMVGLHGIGKSEIVKEFADKNGFHLETLFLSQQEVADLIGIPKEDGNTTYWTKPAWLQRMNDANRAGKHCILFLDELSRATLEVRQSALQLILDRKIHEHSLPELDGYKTLVIAADNPTDLYDTDELDPALLDRFMNFNVEVNTNQWLNWARKNGVVDVVRDYIAEYPDKLHFMPEDSNDLGATPRSWKKLSDLIKNFNSISKEFEYSVILSKLGQTVGNNFYHFYKDYIKIIKPEDIIEAVKDFDLSTVNGIKDASKSLKELIKDMDAIPAVELGNKLFDSKNYNELNAYLDALNVEVATSMIKTWKENEDTEKNYYEWAKTVPDKFIFKKILKVRDE